MAGLRVAPRPSSCKQLFAFTAPTGLVNPMTRIHVRLLGPCFKTGRSLRRPTRWRTADRNRRVACCTSRPRRLSDPEPGHRELTPRRELHPRPLVRSQQFPPSIPVKIHSRAERTSRRRSLLIRRQEPTRPKAGFTGKTSRKAAFTAIQFHVLLTLSSKFFSNFHHCTCFLSVLGSYLALRGVYLALWAALSSNPTLGRDQQSRTTALRAYHPLWAVATVKLDFDRRPNLG